MNRIRWIDVSKAIGIIAIYLGHISTTEGVRCVPFVWTFHVPLFFLVSGCAEAVSKKQIGFVEFLLKKIKGLFIPWLIFALLSTVIHVLITNCSPTEVYKWILEIGKGCIRNKFLAGSLWFLTCILVVQFVFFFIKKLKFKPLILAAATAIHIVARLFFNVNQPKLAFNVDTAAYYILFYAIGYVSFDMLNRFINAKNLKGRILLTLSGVAAFTYLGFRFFNKNVFSPLLYVPYLSQFLSLIGTLIIIYTMILLAKMMENVEILQKIGQSTLYMCCGEYMVHTFVAYTLTFLGLTTWVDSPFHGVVFTIILIAFSYGVVTPILKSIVKWVQTIPDYFMVNRCKEID